MIGLVLVVLIVIVILAGGKHGPGRHTVPALQQL